MGKAKIAKEHFDNTGNYLNNNLVIEYRTRVIKKYFSEISACEIADIGCGNGQISLHLLEKNKITFVDISGNMLHLVKAGLPTIFEHNATILLGDFTKLTYKNQFDLVLCFGVLAHVDNIEDFFLKLKEILFDKGKLVIQFTNSNRFVSKVIKVIHSIKKIFKKSYHYKINYISEKDIVQILNTLQLTYTKRIYYWAELPGFILMPTAIKRFIYFKILNHPLLSKLGGECILFIQK